MSQQLPTLPKRPYSQPTLIRIGSHPGIVAMAGGPEVGTDSSYNGTNFGLS